MPASTTIFSPPALPPRPPSSSSSHVSAAAAAALATLTAATLTFGERPKKTNHKQRSDTATGLDSKAAWGYKKKELVVRRTITSRAHCSPSLHRCRTLSGALWAHLCLLGGVERAALDGKLGLLHGKHRVEPQPPAVENLNSTTNKAKRTQK